MIIAHPRLLLLALCTTLIACAQDRKPAPADVTADQVMTTYIEKTGGDAYDEQTSMIMRGTLTMTEQNLRADITVYAKAPNKLMVYQNMAGVMEMKQGYDGSQGWDANPITGLRQLEGKELENLKLIATYNYLANWQDNFPERKLLGMQDVNDRSTYVIRLVPAKASPITVYIDRDTYQLLRTDSRQISPMGEVDVASYFSDFKLIDGVSTPMTISQETPMGPAVMRITGYEAGADIDDDTFRMPEQPPAPPSR